MMACMVNPEVTAEVMMAGEFNFTDTKNLLRLEMRKGVCQVLTLSFCFVLYRHCAGDHELGDWGDRGGWPECGDLRGGVEGGDDQEPRPTGRCLVGQAFCITRLENAGKILYIFWLLKRRIFINNLTIMENVHWIRNAQVRLYFNVKLFFSSMSGWNQVRYLSGKNVTTHRVWIYLLP